MDGLDLRMASELTDAIEKHLELDFPAEMSLSLITEVIQPALQKAYDDGGTHATNKIKHTISML